MLEAILPILIAYWPLILTIIIIAHFTRNYFHNGLHKYPGPPLARLTDWWRFWDVYNRRPDATHLALHRQHGNIVRLGPNTLSFAHPRAIKQIYGLNKGMTKSGFYPVQQAVSNGHRLPSLFSTTDETYHAQLRRTVNSAFSMSTLVQYEASVNEVLTAFLGQTSSLYASTSQTCNFAQWLQYFAFDVIGQITYSKRHGFVDTASDIDGMVAYLARLFSYVAPVGQVPWLDLLFLKNPLVMLLDRLGFKLFAFPITTFAKTRMAERLADPPAFSSEKENGDNNDAQPASSDLLSKFLAAQHSHPDFMTDARVLTMAVSMSFAGSETTGISLAAVFYYLLHTPHALARLTEELHTSLPPPSDAPLVSWQESQTLPYLDACIKEAFRVHPAAGLPLERVVPEGGMEIDGAWIPGGTIVGVNAWVVHKCAEVFDPERRYPVDEYIPERWLGEKGMFVSLEQSSSSSLFPPLPLTTTLPIHWRGFGDANVIDCRGNRAHQTNGINTLPIRRRSEDVYRQEHLVAGDLQACADFLEEV